MDTEKAVLDIPAENERHLLLHSRPKLLFFVVVSALNLIWLITFYSKAEEIRDTGADFIVAMQIESKGVKTLMQIFTVFGSIEFYLFLVPFVYLLFSPPIGVGIFAVIMSGGYCVSLLKMWHHEPRPYWVDSRVVPLDCSGELGYPSGHSLLSLMLFPYLANAVCESLHRRPWEKAVAVVAGVVAALLIGLSRMYLGLHTYAQVTSGYLIGALLLLTLLRIERLVSHAIERRLDFFPFWKQCVVWVAVGVSLTLVPIISYVVLVNTWEIPSKWKEIVAASVCNSEDDEIELEDSLELCFVVSFCVCGAGIALAAVRKHLNWRWHKSVWWKRVLRLIIALIVVVFFEVGLGAAIPKKPLAVALIFRYGFRYGLPVAICFGFIPWLATKIKLAEPRPEKE